MTTAFDTVDRFVRDTRRRLNNNIKLGVVDDEQLYNWLIAHCLSELMSILILKSNEPCEHDIPIINKIHKEIPTNINNPQVYSKMLYILQLYRDRK